MRTRVYTRSIRTGCFSDGDVQSFLTFQGGGAELSCKLLFHGGGGVFT